MKPIAAAATATVVLGALAMLAVVLLEAAPWEEPASAARTVLPLVLFVVSPYLPLAGAIAIARRPLGAGVALAGTVVATVFGLAVYVDAFVVKKENPLHAFLFAAVPMVQWGIALVTLALAAIFRDRGPAGGSPPA